jgi:hypothetical protein
MGVPAKEIEWEHLMSESTVLEERVTHLQQDVSELKEKADAIDAKLTEHRIETAQGFSALRSDMEKGFGALRAEMNEKLGKLHVALITWVVGTGIATAGTAFTIAKLFK